MSDLILGYIKNRINSDYYRTIAEAVNDVVWLLGEIERLKASPTLGDREDVVAMTASRCAEIAECRLWWRRSTSRTKGVQFMNLEELKKTYRESIKKQEALIDELLVDIEWLKNKSHESHLARRCTEIANEHFNNNNIGSYAEGWRDCADSIATAIKKEFLEEK